MASRPVGVVIVVMAMVLRVIVTMIVVMMTMVVMNVVVACRHLRSGWSRWRR
ncbi:MAG TPA: hypothetical protein VGG92_04910 [Caulobacteraceae bacterium]|jgi:hypothetical protein